MKYTKLTCALALSATSAVLLAACAPSGPTTKNAADKGKATGQLYTVEPTNSGRADLGNVKTADQEIKWASGGEFTSYNYFEADNYSSYNGYVVDQLFGGFSYYGTDGTIYPNKEWGKYEKISDNPLKVKYTINKDAKWSDGTPVTVADYLLDHAAQNSSIVGADGNQLFNHVSASFAEQIPNGPEFEGDPLTTKEFTITFKDIYPDWQLLIGGTVPSHIVAKQAGLSHKELIDAVLAKDAAKLAPAAKFWNTGWNVTSSLGDLSLYPSAGPYKLHKFVPGEYVSLVANENYWGEKPGAKTLTVRFVDPTQQVQALQNGEVSAIAPQATVDTLAQLKKLGNQVIIHEYSTMTYEHLDFNFGGGLFADSKELREAFAYCVPREQIIENLIKPLNSEAELLNAREYFTFQPQYKELISKSYDGRYDKVNIEKAKELIAKSGKTKLDVRIGYSKPNARRSDQVALIKASCDQAGFNVIDTGAETFFRPGGDLSTGNYDIALFAWAGSGQIVSGQNITGTGKPQNNTKYSNKEVDAAWEKVANSLDPKVHLAAKAEIEKHLWDDLYNIPIFTHPGVAANDSKLANVRATSTQSGLPWNISQWVYVEKQAQ